MMMTRTARLQVAEAIARKVQRDVDNRPDFTMTRSQLRHRIADYVTNPQHDDEDLRLIFMTLVFDPALPIRDRNPSASL